MIEFLKQQPFLSGFANHPYDEINYTCAYYPFLIYIFGKANQSKNILEIGTEKGTSAYWLASLAKENDGMYYGIDILPEKLNQTEKILSEAGLPHKLFLGDTKKMDKLHMDGIDLAWVDGEHTTEAVQHEIELIYPHLNHGGWGYIFIHDIVDMGNADIWWKLTQDKRFEHMGMNPNYGLGILRKIEGLDYESIAKRMGVLSLNVDKRKA